MVLYRTIKKCSQYEDLGDNLSQKKGWNFATCFWKKEIFCPKNEPVLPFGVFFPTKKKLHHNHPNIIFAHSCECSEYKSTAAIFFRSIGQLTWGLRFRKNPLKLQINSSSIEIRSGAFFFKKNLNCPKMTQCFEKGIFCLKWPFLKIIKLTIENSFFGDGVTTFLCTATFKSYLETSSQSSQNLTPWDACHADSMKKLEKRHWTVDGDWTRKMSD